MKNKIINFWKDPVGSKIIANAIWLILVAVAGLLYLIYLKVKNSISFKKAYDLLIDYLNQERVIQNWYVLLGIILLIISLVNRQIILSFLFLLYKALIPFNGFTFKKPHHEGQFIINNANNKLPLDITSEGNITNYNIKPVQETKQWRLNIIFSHSRRLLYYGSSVNFETMAISKDYHENKLMLETFDKHGQRNDSECKILMNEYEDQEISLSICHSFDDGGIICTIKRLDSILHISELKYGCQYFTINSMENNYDYALKVTYST